MDSLSNVDLANIDLNDPEQTKHLSRETLNKLKHQQLHEQHKGHEEMHAKMVLVMFGTLFAGQILLFMWRKKHPRSYNLGMFYPKIRTLCSAEQCALERDLG